MKNTIITILVFLLIASLGLSYFVAKDLTFAEPKYEAIHWSKSEQVILNKAYAELGNASKVPFGYYPYKIIQDENGTSVRFRSYNFLQLRKSALLDEDIMDGCVYIHFDKSMKLRKVSYCG
ncbi:hypothetical protein [Microbulbifer sp. RZ01]|uniref:hypothetical protein n=1 Tax=Microbulbifer sp. RZ01 TaxID=3021711 RepID=UPI0027E481F3|nr:hypothetical protein [Microbulbifer sp. RZ01]